MAGKTLSKRKLGELIGNMTPAAALHSKRCKKLAEFVLSCVEEGTPFTKEPYNEKELISAISFHDFGKSFISLDTISLRYCKKAADKTEYRRHVSAAEEYIKENSEVDVKARNGRSFDKYLYDCSVFHHEAYDGSGFPQGLSGKDIPFAARLCAAVDFIDTALDFDMGAELPFEETMEALKNASGSLLDPTVCKLILKNREGLAELCNAIAQSQRRSAGAKSGVTVTFLGQYTAFSYALVGYETRVTLHDTLFGDVTGEFFRPMAAKSEVAVRLDRLVRHKTLRHAEKFVRHEINFGRVTLFESLRSLSKKSYVSELQKLLYVYEVEPTKLTVCVPEDILLSDASNLVEPLNQLHEMGVRLSVDGFGNLASSFELFEKIKFDEVRLGKKLVKKVWQSKDAFNIASGLVTIARNLGMDVVCSEIETVEDERTMTGMGVNILSGILYGGEMTANALENVIKEEGEEGAENE